MNLHWNEHSITFIFSLKLVKFVTKSFKKIKTIISSVRSKTFNKHTCHKSMTYGCENSLNKNFQAFFFEIKLKQMQTTICAFILLLPYLDILCFSFRLVYHPEKSIKRNEITSEPNHIQVEEIKPIFNIAAL